MDKLDRIKNMEHELAELKKQVQEKNLWPKRNDVYFWIDGGGAVYKSFYENNIITDKFQSMGNVFSTREEAEREVKKRKLLVKMREAAKDGIVAGLSEYKYSIYYDQDCDDFDVAATMKHYPSINDIHFPSILSAEIFIDENIDDLRLLVE